MIEWEEFQQLKRSGQQIDWLEPTQVRCPECGERIYKDKRIVLTSFPEKHRYVCKNCKWEGCT